MQTQEVGKTQAEGLPHSAVERMAEAMEKAMGVQQEHPIAREVGMREAFLADVVALATRARQVLASAETQALDSVVKELEGVISFMRLGYSAAFTVCFEERGWPNVENAEMQ